MTRRIESLSLGVFFCALFGLLLRKLTDYDIWYHLAIGREILKNAAIPPTEILTYSAANQPIDYHEWGYAVLTYVTQSVGGEWGLSVLNALLATGTLLALDRAAAVAGRAGAPSVPRWVVLLGVVAVSQFRWVHRPEMVLLVTLAVAVYILERARRAPASRVIWFMPALAFVLNQFHPSALFLVMVLGAYALEATLAATPAKRWKILARFVLVATVTLIAAAVNPYGWKQVWLPVDFVLQRELLQGLTEFLPAMQTPYAAEVIVTAAVGLIAVGAQRPVRVAHALLFVLFTYLAFRYVRNLALLAVVMFVPVAHLVTGLAERFSRSRATIWIGVTFVGAAYSALLALAVVRNEWGAGPFDGLFPIAAANALERDKPPGRLFNFYDTGGYLAWRAGEPGRVFVDGRHYETDLALQQHNAVFSAAPQWREILRQYKVGSIVTASTLRYSGELVPLTAELIRAPDWSPVAMDTGGILFVLSAFAKHPLERARVWEQVLRDAAAIYAEFPYQTGAVRTMSIAYHELGQISSAIGALQFYVNKNPDRDDSKVLLEQWRAQANAIDPRTP